MKKSFGFAIALLLCNAMGCNGVYYATGNNPSSGSGGSSPQIPAAPTALTASAGSAQVSLTWSASVNATGYHVKRGVVSGGPYTLLAPTSSLSYTDTSASNGTTYYYVVTAYNTAGESGNSNEASAKPAHVPTTYYVSPSGSDSAAGTLEQPFATVQHGVNQLLAGDTLILRAGNYHESVTVASSGTASAPITLAAYSGETPTLIGSQPVTGPWTLSSGSIYSAPWPSQPLQVFSDGHLLNEARWPNSPIESLAGMTYSIADAGDSTSLTKAGLPPVDLTGAWLRVMAGEAWVGYERQIVTDDQATGKLTWSEPVNQLSELIPRRGNKFIVFGKLNLLDAPGEWYWDPNAQMLYVWTQDGASPAGRIEAGVAPAVLNLSGQSYVTVNGLQARGGWFNLQNSTSCAIKNFLLYAPNWIRGYDGYNVNPQFYGGIEVSGSGNLIDGGLIEFAGRASIYLAGSGNTVRQVTIQDSGMTWSNDAGIVASDGTQNLIQNNTIQRTSLAGATLGSQLKVFNNLITTPCLFMEDCGNLNAWSPDDQGTEIAYNILQNNQVRWGAAIYLDAGSHNFYLHDNLAQQILWSGANITSTDTIENNTFLDVQHQGINFVPGANVIGADWSAGIAAHNQVGEPFPIEVALAQPTSIIPDYAYYFAYVTLAPSPGPRRVEVDFSQMVQPAWSQNQLPMDLSQVWAIVFTFDPIVNSFNYTVSNLRMLPAGATGDTGAVAVNGGNWTVSCNGGSTCALTNADPTTWGDTGSSVFDGQNVLNAPLQSSLSDLTSYRGLAFELAGSASRTYNFQGYQDVDNGPAAEPGRGATLPPNIGATPGYVAP
ncbi:MAG: right-handed parallel beta-helix repeat-containing protein [Terracidiphilus sp.]